MRRFSLLLALILSTACAEAADDSWSIVPDPAIVDFPLASAESVNQILVAPPFLPDHEQVASGPPRIVNVRMEIVEREVEIAPGVFVWQMAFDNSVPGPVPVVFQWDWVNLTLVNGTTDSVLFRQLGSEKGGEESGSQGQNRLAERDGPEGQPHDRQRRDSQVLGEDPLSGTGDVQKDQPRYRQGKDQEDGG